MDWSDAASIGSAAAPVVGAILGNNAAAGNQNAANNAYQAALQAFAGISVPTIQQQQLQLQQESSAGQLTPAQIQAQQQQASLLNNISTDPRIANAQYQALAQMGQISQKGMTPADQAAMTMAANSSAQTNAAQQGQILQNMAARGEGGSGAELIARLQASQANANALQNAQLQQAQMQQQARMQALSQTGAMGSNMQQASFNQQAAQAQAQNAINQFNTNTVNQAQAANVASQNQAQAANLANAQNISNTNTGISNQQRQYNSQLYQTNYQNQLQKAAGESGQFGNIGRSQQQQAANTAASGAAMGQGVGTMVGALGKAFGGSSGTPKTDADVINADPSWMDD